MEIEKVFQEKKMVAEWLGLRYLGEERQTIVRKNAHGRDEYHQFWNPNLSESYYPYWQEIWKNMDKKNR